MNDIIPSDQDQVQLLILLELVKPIQQKEFSVLFEHNDFASSLSTWLCIDAKDVP